MIKQIEYKTILNPRDGNGSMSIGQIMSEKELENKVTLIARVLLDPFSEIGYHMHIGEKETYYILSGKGIFIDESRSEIEVSSGDVCSIKENEGHGIRNTSNMQMDILAVVVK